MQGNAEDTLLEILLAAPLLPSRARQRILDIAATQLSDGTCFHQYQPLTKKGNAEIGGDFYDDHLWLVLSTCAYVKESGDVSILQAPCGYADREYAGEGDQETLLHHLETSIASASSVPLYTNMCAIIEPTQLPRNTCCAGS